MNWFAPDDLQQSILDAAVKRIAINVGIWLPHGFGEYHFKSVIPDAKLKW